MIRQIQVLSTLTCAVLVAALSMWPIRVSAFGPAVALASPQSRADVQDPANGQVPQTVRGIVVNGATNQPLARALVQVDGRSLLTAHDGRFAFPGVIGDVVTVTARKPGFYGTTDFIPMAVKMVATGSAGDVEMLLYPEALITGTVRGPDGQPIPQVFVQAWRRAGDESSRQWFPSGQTNTNADGEFRIPLQAGDYVVETQYAPGRPVGGEAVLPMLASGGGGGTLVPMHVAVGGETRLDLRPLKRETHSVTIHLDDESGDSSGNEGRAMPMQWQARMSNGLTFRVATRRGDNPGEIVATLPRGTYTLIAQRVSQTGSSYGETRVSVADRDVQGVALHVTRVLPLDVEIAVDPEITSDNKPPTAQQLGLNFVPADAVPGAMNLNFFMFQGGEGSGPTLLPGRYRLRSSASLPWFVESASLGGSDLLTQDLVVEAGSSLGPLRLVVSNLTGTLRGTVKLRGGPAECTVYLIPTSPGLAPVAVTRSNPDGSLDRGFMPPGSYRVLASEAPLNVSLSDAGVQAKFASFMQTVTIAAGETADVELEAVPAAELQP